VLLAGVLGRFFFCRNYSSKNDRAPRNFTSVLRGGRRRRRRRRRRWTYREGEIRDYGYARSSGARRLEKESHTRRTSVVDEP